MAKPKLIFIGDESCEPCKKALPVFRRFIDDNHINAQVIDIEEINQLDNPRRLLVDDDALLIPIICSMDGNSVGDCIRGYSKDLERKLEEMISNRAL